MINTINELVEKLNKATEEYEKGTPIMSDMEWDKMYFTLVDLEKESGYEHPESPTKIIYPKIVSKLITVPHNHAMLSLAKTKEIDEVNDFIFVGKKRSIAMLKLDGLTCSLRYVNGHLVSAETRGNGYAGEDILHNALVIPSIPKHIPYKEELIVDGEIICRYNDFDDFKKDYKNPRNFAAGSIRLLDANECQNRKLTFVVWEVIKGLDDIFNLSKKLLHLNKWFITVPFVEISVFNEILIDALKDEANLRSYPIDGVVIKYDDIAYGKTLGATAHHFNNAIAYKFYDELYDTELKYIDWTMGRTGVLTPLAVFEPVEMDGTIVERASLHNLSVMRETMGECCYAGQKIKVMKANQIIPQVHSAEKMNYADVVLKGGASVDGLSGDLFCPVCGGATKIVTSDTGVRNLVCDNPQCEGKLINILDHYCSKKGLDIKGLSKATLEKLIDWGWVETFADLYHLHLNKSEWIKKPGFGEKSVSNILAAIEKSKDCELKDFIAALGIPLIGKTVSKELVKYINDYIDFRNKIDEDFDFSSIDGFGPAMDEAIKNFDYTYADYIYNHYLNDVRNIKQDKTNNPLEGMTIVITGKLKTFKNRDALKEVIETNGGKVATKISGKTDYLINNDVNSTTAKNKEAQALGVKIISEEEFIKFFDKSR